MDAQNGFLNYSAAGRPYADQWELMSEEMALLDYRLYLFYKYHQWLGPQNDMRNMLGLVVTREEFEHNMNKAEQRSLLRRISEEELNQLLLSLKSLQLRCKRTDPAGIPLLLLFERFGLREFEKNCVLLAYAGALDEKYEKLFAYLQDDITRKQPSVSLAVSLFMERGGHAAEYIARVTENSSFCRLFDRENLGKGLLVLAPEVLSFLNRTASLPTGFRLFTPPAGQPQPLLVQQGVGKALDSLFAVPEGVGVLCGVPGSGRHYQVEQLCARHGEKCLFVDLTLCGREPQLVERAAMTARLLDSCLCLCGADETTPEGEWQPPAPALAEAIVRADLARGRMFILSAQPLQLQPQRPMLELTLEPLSTEERLILFRAALERVPLAAEVSLEELAVKFHFTPRQIMQAAALAQGIAQVEGQPVSAEKLHQCCYRQVVHKLDALARRVRPGFSWDELILPRAQKNLIQQACAHVRYQHKIYSEWGFGKRLPYGRGLSILFDGVPGTGKTMCAQIMAKELNMEMYKINLSQVVSKYIGETEKNLQTVFREAKNSDCILFFDECDSLFAKRGEVKDSHDRNANVETAYLLQQIEEYDGVCVLATNLLQNIDEAFLRRITYVVHFPFPDAAARQQIYRSTLPASAPVEEDVDWEFLAERFKVSGGYIKNIVLAAAFMAAREQTEIGMRHFLNAAVNELKKNEIVVVREELQEYADLLEEY